jgi:hypothetical protein
LALPPAVIRRTFFSLIFAQSIEMLYVCFKGHGHGLINSDKNQSHCDQYLGT